ncbi:MAG: efflux RND transporter permease subunit [Gammaproteobacteria bacterium]|nr:efflux RND transporter permease subunit [Gammaproteobacteria bacterium]
MTLPELSIKRHVLAWMLSGVLVLFGLIAYLRIGMDRFPQVEFPFVSVTTTLKGGNPDIIDASVTSIIESAINSVPGIKSVQSSSSPGVSVVGIEFELGKDLDVAFNEVQAKINQSVRLLPEDADVPVVSKMETGASPVLWLSLQGDRTLQQLNLYARNVVKKRLENIDGVGGIIIGGERRRQIRVNLDINRMAALDIAPQDLQRAFAEGHVKLPGGFLVGKQVETILNLDAEAHDLDALRHLVVTYRAGAPILLQDVAQIVDGLADFRQVARFNGAPTVGLGVVMVRDANAVAMIDAVYQRLDSEIIPQLPPGMKITVSSDNSIFIREMVATLKEHIVEATVLAALVVFLFLKSLRSMLIIAVAIPVSLLAAVAAMYFSGYTFNTMTLLALLLLIGVVVDDAIVVLENIFRHRQYLDPDPQSAAINGSRQVVFAVLASTLTLVSIFAPVIFMQGIIGRFFESFAVVVTVGVLTSWFVAMSLTPMLCSRYLQVAPRHGPVYRFLDEAFRRLDESYRRALAWSLDHRWQVVLTALAIVLSSGLFFAKVGKGFVPEEDEGRFMVFIKTPLGSNIDYTEGRLHLVEQKLAGHREIRSYFTAIGLGQAGQVNQGIAFVRLVGKDQRTLKQFEIMAALRDELATIPGVRAFPGKVPIVGGQRGEPLQFSITGPELNRVGALAEQMKGRLATLPELGRVDLDLQLNLPQLDLHIDRVRAASLGLTPQDIAYAVSLLGGGVNVARYNDVPGDGERYEIRLRASEEQLQMVSDFSRIFLRGRDGQRVRLDSVAELTSSTGPAIIARKDLRYAANFFSTPTMPLGEAAAKVRQLGAELLPLGYELKTAGEAEEMAKTAGYMMFAFGMALLLLYMVLASQFNSFMQPLIIMVAQPLAIIGGVVALYVTGNTLNIYSMIGMVLLVGLVAKNSILLVDMTNQLRADGHGVRQALLEACPIRMRPVLMTSLTIILAMLPAAIGAGAGAESNMPLSITVIGGMVTSTLLTLVVVPAVYSLLDDGLMRWQRFLARRHAHAGG